MLFQLKAHEKAPHLSTNGKPFGFYCAFLTAEHLMIWLNMTRKLKRSNEQQGSDLNIRDQTR